MKKFWDYFWGISFFALIVVFAVSLVNKAIKGDSYSLFLLVWEIVVMVYPFVVDEIKIPTWKQNLWMWGIILWFIAALIWASHQLGIC